MIVQTPGTITPLAMPSITTVPVMPMDMTASHLPVATPRAIERPDEFIRSPLKRLSMFLVTMTAPLIFATGCDFFKKTKQDELQPVSLTLDAAVKGAIPREAYVIGKSKSVTIPKNGRLPRWRVSQLKNQAKRKAYKSLDLTLRREIVARMGGCLKEKIHHKIIKTEHKEVKDTAPDGTLQIHYEFWILWDEAFCKKRIPIGAYRVRIDEYRLGNTHLPR